jgi:hypothetical protein
MKHLKIMGLCLVAAFFMSAVAVATASAAEEPELRKAGGGELTKGTAFLGKGTGTKFVLATKGQGTIECTSLTVKGEVQSPTEAEVTTTFTGCTTASILKCNSEEEKTESGRIRSVISSRPRWTRGSRRHILLLLTILPRTRQVRINCGGTTQTLKVNGGFLVDAGEIEKAHKVLKFEAKQTEGKQELTEFETGAKSIEEKAIETTTLETEGEGLKKFGKTLSGEEATGEVEFTPEVEFRS